MPQNFASCKESRNSSSNFTTETLFKCEIDTKLFSDHSSHTYRDRHDPLSSAIQYSETHKALGYGIGKFKKIYTAYVKQGGAK